ncbi:hypothetical protein [Legionella israelensis]|uniref:Uncharacterized protein n=1 Tax=Legionella israelensis TaxID=454 RepID=A0A0W0V2J7_9GAMM|nr:hypothetical protein [Legionella israelensis]KTD14332.1 hypothetical protein Lisr_2560 [Legionella israelensis]QBS09758.1 hypothetical protein E4T55_07740 [Legionella israelensis]SCY59072.1 hypothetical protein SAMN02746069_02970 [Legionella israelensis DSM 19235]STX59303.1 Uncharacterised protein [Legionella israelensis]
MSKGNSMEQDTKHRITSDQLTSIIQNTLQDFKNILVHSQKPEDASRQLTQRIKDIRNIRDFKSYQENERILQEELLKWVNDLDFQGVTLENLLKGDEVKLMPRMLSDACIEELAKCILTDIKKRHLQKFKHGKAENHLVHSVSTMRILISDNLVNQWNYDVLFKSMEKQQNQKLSSKKPKPALKNASERTTHDIKIASLVHGLFSTGKKAKKKNECSSQPIPENPSPGC